MTTLIDLVIQQILFFANASDADVHPDVAVSQVEILVAELNSLSMEDKASVQVRIRERLSSASGAERKSLVELESMLE